MALALGIPDLRGVISFEIASTLLRVRGAFNTIAWNKGCAYVGKARNSIAATYLKSDCEKLLFLDTDLSFTEADFLRISSHDVDIVAGLYPTKEGQKSLAMCWPQQNGLTGLQPVQRIATGFMCIKRAVFDRVAEFHGDRRYWDFATAGVAYDFFPCGLEFGGRDDQGLRVWMSEDYSFCEMARAAGCGVFADYDVRVGHLGACEYKVAENKPAEALAT